MKNKNTVFVIGALGGLGHDTVKALVRKGWFVFAADIDETVCSAFSSVDKVTPMHLDITNQDSVDNAFKLIDSQTDGLDAIIHMAGVLKIGAMVEVSIEDIQTALEINLLGVFRVNRKLLPLLLKRKGRIIILSSEVGRQTAAPFNGIYSMTKQALEAYADALRRELIFLGIKVIKIQPGPIKTEMTKNAEQLFVEAVNDSKYFKKNIAKGITYLPKVYKNAHDPIYVTKAIIRSLEAPNPRTAYTVKRDLPRRILDWLPAKWADRLIAKMLS